MCRHTLSLQCVYKYVLTAVNVSFKMVCLQLQKRTCWGIGQWLWLNWLIRGLIPVIGKNYIERLLSSVNCIEKTKIKKKEAGNGPFLCNIWVYGREVLQECVCDFFNYFFPGSDFSSSSLQTYLEHDDDDDDVGC